MSHKFILAVKYLFVMQVKKIRDVWTPPDILNTFLNLDVEMF